MLERVAACVATWYAEAVAHLVVGAAGGAGPGNGDQKRPLSSSRT